MKGNIWLKRVAVIFGALIVVQMVVGLILKTRYPSRGDADHDGFEVRRVMDGMEERATLTELSSGTITAVMAGIELDMRDVVVAPEGGHLTVKAVMAGVELVLPASCRIELNKQAVMGDIELLSNDGAGPDSPVLTVDARAVMGGIELIQEPAWDGSMGAADWPPLDADEEPA